MDTKEKWIMFDWGMVALTALLVLLRVCVRSSRQNDRNTTVSTTSRTRGCDPCFLTMRLSDLFAIVAWVFLVLTIIPYHIIVTRYAGQLFDEGDSPSPSAIRLYLISQIMDTNSLFAIKIAVILTYREFIWSPKHHKWLTALQIFTAMSWAVDVVLFAPLICHAGDPSYFEPAPPAVVANVTTYYVLHITTDLLIYLFPIPTIVLPLLRQTHLPEHNRISTGKKVRVSISFLAGFLCIATAAINLLGAAGVIALDLGYILDTVEQTYAIMVVCMPTTISCMVRCYRRLTKRFQDGQWRRDRGSISPVELARRMKKRKGVVETITAEASFHGTESAAVTGHGSGGLV